MITRRLSKLCHTLVAKMPHECLEWEAKLDWVAWPINSAKLYHTFISNNSIKRVMVLFLFFRLHGGHSKGGHAIIAEVGDGASVKE